MKEPHEAVPLVSTIVLKFAESPNLLITRNDFCFQPHLIKASHFNRSSI